MEIISPCKLTPFLFAILSNFSFLPPNFIDVGFAISLLLYRKGNTLCGNTKTILLKILRNVFVYRIYLAVLLLVLPLRLTFQTLGAVADLETETVNIALNLIRNEN